MNTNLLGQGRARLFQISPGGIILPKRPFRPNTFMYESATILSQLLRGDPQGRDWRVRMVYLEFENNHGAVVSVPSIDRSQGKAYFDSLSGSATRDYLRVPVVSTKIESEDDELYPGGNKVTYFCASAGDEGVHGKEFSAAQQSVVYGAALVVTPVPDDPSQDLVFSRLCYDDPDDQQAKTPSSQVAIEYELPFS